MPEIDMWVLGSDNIKIRPKPRKQIRAHTVLRKTMVSIPYVPSNEINKVTSYRGEDENSFYSHNGRLFYKVRGIPSIDRFQEIVAAGEVLSPFGFKLGNMTLEEWQMTDGASIFMPEVDDFETRMQNIANDTILTDDGIYRIFVSPDLRLQTPYISLSIKHASRKIAIGQMNHGDVFFSLDGADRAHEAATALLEYYAGYEIENNLDNLEVLDPSLLQIDEMHHFADKLSKLGHKLLQLQMLPSFKNDTIESILELRKIDAKNLDLSKIEAAMGDVQFLLNRLPEELQNVSTPSRDLVPARISELNIFKAAYGPILRHHQSMNDLSDAFSDLRLPGQ